jgi:hypothetical protein
MYVMRAVTFARTARLPANVNYLTGLPIEAWLACGDMSVETVSST